jgi:ZipA-like protein with FtsZ-binding domain
VAIDFIAGIDAPAPIPDAVLGELLSRVAACGKRVRAAGFNASIGEWEDLGRAGGIRGTSLRLALQLVDRTGPVTAPQLGVFSDAVKHCAGRIGATAEMSDVQAALKTARDLDGFCAEVDVAIGLNIVAPEGGAFAGTRIRALAEAAGFKLEPEGVFHYRDDQRGTLFTLDNHEPAPFIPEQIKSLSTTGITLLLDVPCVSDGQHALGRMIDIAKGLAEALGGRLVDDNRVALNDPGLSKIRQQLNAIHATMEARGVNAGSARALRLFA